MSFDLILPWLTVFLGAALIIAVIALLTARKSPVERKAADESSDVKVALTATLCITLIIMLMTGGYYVIALWVRPPRVDAMCVRNLKQIGAAFEIYLADHDGYMPPATDALMRYLEDNRNLLSCPANGDEYVFVGLAGKVTDETDSSRTVLAYDQFKHRHRKDERSVLYLDGRVEMISEAALINQLYEQRASRNAKEKPE